MDITVNCQLTPEEVGRAFTAGSKSQLRIVQIGLPAALILAAAVFFAMGSPIAGTTLVLAALVLPFVFFRLLRRNIAQQLDHLCEPSTVRVTDDGYEQRAEKYATEIQWSMFDRVEAGSEFWLFFSGRRCLAFLPRRVFDETQRAEIDAMLATRLRAETA